MPGLPKALDIPMLLRKVRPGEEGVGTWEGLTHDYTVIHGITSDLRRIIIEGQPVQTGMNAEELQAFIADRVVKDSTEAMESTPAFLELCTCDHDLGDHQHKCEKCDGTGKVREVCDTCKGAGAILDPSNTEKPQRLKCVKCEGIGKISGKDNCEECKGSADISGNCELCDCKKFQNQVEKAVVELKKLIEPENQFPVVVYVFGSDVIVQYGRVDRQLREFGTVEPGNKVVHIDGFMTVLPRPIDVGKEKLKVHFFYPVDWREVDKGGMMQVKKLSADEQIVMAGWLEHASKWATVLGLNQKVKSLERDLRTMREMSTEKDSTIGELKASVMELEKQVGQQSIYSRSALVLNVFITLLGSGVLVGVLFWLIGAAIPATVSTTPIYNQTSGAPLCKACVSQTIIPNAAASAAPLFGTLLGMFLGALAFMRKLKGRGTT